MPRYRWLAPLGGAVVVGGVAVWFFTLTPSRPAPVAPPPAATYVGAEACASCHRAAYDAWNTSQHHDAMQPATAASVKGRFDGRQVRNGTVVSTMFRRDGHPWVRTDGPDGAPTDFPVEYTFGVFPLQQYLVAMPRGRLQALPLAWDARAIRDGGQRWFHLYPGQIVAHGDPLHWTGREQNWNFMCADCHTTGLKKNYEPSTDTFTTTWAALGVTCEACHGPGSRHVRSGGRGGLTARLDERANVAWTVDAGSGRPVRSAPRTTTREIDVCAVCHARRAAIAGGYVPGAALMDFYEPSPLVSPLYYPDGQQRDEVYVYGSFMQSRMAGAGVTCSDCHDPHTARLRAEGNALCTRCHAPSRYDAPSHTHHTAATPGAQCVNCHMPSRTYMQIDARRDHSLRVPRPDVSVATGVPNACTACHSGRSAQWAAVAVRQWYGRDARGLQDFAEAFHDADAGRPGSAAALAALASSPAEPAVVRASALARMPAAAASGGAAAGAVSSSDPLVRLMALRVVEQLEPAEQIRLAGPRLRDPVRSVRIAAARLLAPVSGQLPDAYGAAFPAAAAELIASERYNADRPERRVALGGFLFEQGRTREAEREFRAAIDLVPDFAPAYVYLAELLRRGGAEAQAETTLRQGLARMPASADLHYALGLSLTRSHRTAEALEELRRATTDAPGEARFAYGYALSLNGAGQPDAAIRLLSATAAAHPGDRDVLFALVSFERDAGRLAAAREHAAQLLRRFPDDEEARALHQSLIR